MVEVLKLYCMDCKEWVYDKDSHECPINHWVVADEIMIGIADRLYERGITPMTALWTSTELETDYKYLLTLQIDIGRRISEMVLGELPENWKYHWETVSPDRSELHMLGYTEHWYNLGFEVVDERLETIIKEFEFFLDTRDAGATKAIITLLG